MRPHQIALHRLHAQGLAQPIATTALEVVTRLGALQAQDHAGALWSIGLRLPDATRVEVERAIAARTIVRTWPMRGTLHFVPAADVRWMLALMAPRVIASAAGRHRALELDDATFRRSRTIVTRALAKAGVMTRSALFAALERGGIVPAGQRGIHILQRHSMEALICFGPHDDRQPTFVLLDEWVPAAPVMERDDALRTIAARYFGGHGPARLRDFAGWTGLTMADARRGLALAEPLLERVPGTGDDAMWMAHDDRATGAPAQRALLLPGFDELMLGYKDRSASLPAEHAARICPGGNGMFSNTLVADGQVVGTWTRTTRAAGVRVEATSFVALRKGERARFEVPAARLADFLGIPVTIAWRE